MTTKLNRILGTWIRTEMVEMVEMDLDKCNSAVTPESD
jgi:hypothetical protein